MTDKNAGKGRPAPGKTEAPPADELLVARQIHTLVQMAYGQLAATHPWLLAPWNGAAVPPMAPPVGQIEPMAPLATASPLTPWGTPVQGPWNQPEGRPW